MSLSAGNPNPVLRAAETVNGDNDPFADWVFREPRQPHFSVRELNDAALRRLLGRFDRLIAGPLPRPGRRLDQAQLVVSPQPGYGKSHLIGRLFAALEGRATLIYVTPFHSPSLCWQSILLRVVQELSFPDRQPSDELPPQTQEAGELPTQLDAFAHGVLAHLVAGLIESGRAHHDDPSGAAAWLRDNPMDAFMLSDPGHPWAQWLQEVFEAFHRDMESALRRAGLSMHSPGWLRVLFRYAASQPGDEIRAHCVAWLSGQPLEPAEGALLGLRSGEMVPAETPDQINEMCWRRLLDFCQLAAFYRPFVFCFDQTEAYGHSPALARCFGMVIAQIHLLATNEMMVITANQQPWEENVASHMETADKDRFVPLPLEGIRRAQAEELVRWRCRQHDIPKEQADAFLEAGWLAARFPTERNRMGIRQFLQACSARWQKPEDWWEPMRESAPEPPVSEPKPPVAAAPPPAPPAPKLVPVPVVRIPRIGLPSAETPDSRSLAAVPMPVNADFPVVARAASPALKTAETTVVAAAVPTLHDLHDRYTRETAMESKRLSYNPDIFRWLLGEVAHGQAGLTIEVQPEGTRTHLPLSWTLAADDPEDAPGQVFFGFEPGENWKRWRTILCEVQDRCLPPPLSLAGGGSRQAAPAKAVFLRTFGQSALPAPGWEISGEIDSARRTCFDVIELDETAVAELYAAHGLYLDAAAGDLPYSTDEVMAFLRAEMEPLWQRIQQPMPGEPEPVFGDAMSAAG